jgi:hypothetical protein
MNSPILMKLSKRKSGWRPKMVVDTKTKKARRDACMVTNGKSAKMIEVEGADDRELDDKLEASVLETIAQLEQRDREILYREVIIFSAIANASINQSMFFLPLVQQEAKMKLNQFKNQTERFVSVIQKEAIGVHGDQMKMVLDSLEDAVHRTFQKFGDALITGKLPAFIEMIEAFETKEVVLEEKPKKAPAKKKKPVAKKKGLKVVK